MKKIYSDDELFCNNEQKAYSGDAGCVDFLLGGIGTGNVSLGARGNLTTWQIFNQPYFSIPLFFLFHLVPDMGTLF